MNNLEKFYEAMRKNETLRQEAEALNKELEGQETTSKEMQQKIAERMVQLAEKHGIELTTKELLKQESGELSEDEMDAVAGGAACACVIAGGGDPSRGEGAKTCICTIIGVGNGGHGLGKDCICAFGGGGADY